MFSVLGEVAYVGDVLSGPIPYSLLVTTAICSRDAHYVGYMGFSIVMERTTVGTVVDGIP